MSRAILLSGGIDSMALAYLVKPEFAITFDYGHLAAKAELKSSTVYCSEVGLSHQVIRIDCSEIGLGMMVPGGNDIHSPRTGAIAPTPEWWPFRNQLLITLAAARAVAIGVEELYVGAVVSDGVHADGKPGFYGLMDDLLHMQEGTIRLMVPAIGLKSAELVKRSKIPLSLLGWSHSCHRGNLACGLCRGCFKHHEVFREVFDTCAE